MVISRFSRWQPPPSWISKIAIFGHVTVTGFNIWCSAPNFIKIGRFFTEIWRFDDFQNGGCPPSCILKICIFLSRSPCRTASSYKISLKSDNRLMSNGQKKRFSRWRPPPSWILKISIFGHVTVIRFNIWCNVPSFIKIGRFFTEIWRFNHFQNGGRPPSWILKNCSFCHAARIDMPFCFLIQNFAEIGQSIDELWPKNRF